MLALTDTESKVLRGIMAITDWPEFERPREKLLAHGANHLSDAELLAIFLRVGTRGKSAVDLARELISHFGSLRALVNAPLEQFCEIHGMGSAKYVQLQASVELSKRFLLQNLQEGDAINSAQEAKRFLQLRMSAYKKEVFAALFLNSQHHVISFKELFFGSIDQAPVYTRDLVEATIKQHAAALIIAHNHPSGDPSPSQADIHITRKIKDALELIDVKLLDHLIIGHNKVTSLAELGHL